MEWDSPLGSAVRRAREESLSKQEGSGSEVCDRFLLEFFLFFSQQLSCFELSPPVVMVGRAV